MEALKQKIPYSIYRSLLEKNIVSLEQLILMDELEVWEMVQLNYTEFKQFLQLVYEIYNRKKFQTVNSLPKWTRISTSCDSINNILQGGVPTKQLVEIYGASGVGKTQIALQISLSVQLPLHLGGLGRGAIYICTEDAFPSKRLNELAKAFTDRFNVKIAYQDNIFIKHVVDFDQLYKCLSIAISPLLRYKNIGLIIIDSIAALYRSESVNYVERSRQFSLLAERLLEHGRTYNCGIICINQVTDHCNEVTPCLGLAWTNLISYRLSVKKDNKRTLSIIFSPDLPSNSCHFNVTSAGII